MIADLERFCTQRVIKVIDLAMGEAGRLNHHYLGTEHLLLGLVTEDSGVGGVILRNFGLNLQVARTDVEKLVKPSLDLVSIGRLPETPRYKMAFVEATEYARSINHHYVGTEHLTVGLLRVPESVAFQVLNERGITHEMVVKEVENLLGVGSFRDGNVKQEIERLLCVPDIGRIGTIVMGEQINFNGDVDSNYLNL